MFCNITSEGETASFKRNIKHIRISMNPAGLCVVDPFVYKSCLLTSATFFKLHSGSFPRTTRLYRTDACSGDKLVPGNAGCYPKECRLSVGLHVQQHGDLDRYKWLIFLVTKLLM